MAKQQRGHRKPGQASPVKWRGQADGDRPPVLGVDVGGVIVDRAAENSDTSFFGLKPMDTPAVDGALDALQQLTVSFEWRVHLVSKARSTTAATSRRWLEHIDFHSRTGIDPHNVHFVQNRQDKVPVCERFGVTHFIDDRVEVLGYLRDCVPRRYLFTGGLGTNGRPNGTPTDLIVVGDWTELRELIERTLRP
ncbi:hypothetical protein [Antrihabitans spumae]|uniref:Uncharacterized protein n=1 Tax=Antrihabitans spumae TaxID=3373370 RepID=A0ABW7KI62_9NOCA